jgi:D-serine deaminase-like pyridoxal phosphate-dependent protein
MDSPSISLRDRAPAAVGASLRDVDTPSLVVDLDAAERNIDRLVELTAAAAAAAAAPPPHLRVHFKAHKCVALALLQVARSRGRTRGLTCQKVVEAEALVAGGVRDVLVSNEVVAPRKIARLAALAADARNRIGVVVDSAENARALSAAGAAAGGSGGGATLHVLVEVDVGQGRCGVPDAAAAVALARVVAELPGLALEGLQCYHGGLQHVRSAAARHAAAARVAELAAAARDALLAAGLPCATVSGGGSGTFAADAAAGVLTELQPGSYIFNDADYARNGAEGGGDGEGGPDGADGPLCFEAPFEPSLYLLTQVMSARAATASAGAGDAAATAGREWVVADSGLKAQSVDSGPPVAVATLTELERAGFARPRYDAVARRFDSAGGRLAVLGVSDEHTTLALGPGAGAGAVLPAVGEALLLMPGHCDPTCNVHDWLVGVRRGVVEGVWPLAARSPGY